MRSQPKRSPLKRPPLRNPGQSLNDYWHNEMDDKLLGYILIPAILIGWLVMAWMQYLRPSARAPWVLTLITLIFVLRSAYKMPSFIARMRAVRKGMLGEMAVGQFLEQFRRLGYQIFHDVPGDKALGQQFNLDHVLIGPAGVFTIETKYVMKPQKGLCIVEVQQNRLTVNGAVPERDPLIQAKAQGRWLQELLSASTGEKFKVQPVVIYPGWYIRNLANETSVWVLNEQLLESKLAHAPQILPEDRIRRAAYQLNRYVIGEAAKTT